MSRKSAQRTVSIRNGASGQGAACRARIERESGQLGMPWLNEVEEPVKKFCASILEHGKGTDKGVKLLRADVSIAPAEARHSPAYCNVPQSAITTDNQSIVTGTAL